jgi:cytoskeletal protein RodZ
MKSRRFTMIGQINHRRIKKRKSQVQNSKVKFIGILVIMGIAVFLGYLTARFVIGSLLGYNSDESPITITEETKDSTDSSQASTEDSTDDSASDSTDDSASTVTSSGYALQFGAFSTESAAKELKETLAEKGIETNIVQDGEIYKVISPIIKQKDEAESKMSELKEQDVQDVFIASF